MPRFIARKSHKVGLAPGSLVPVEAPTDEPVRMHVLDYDAEGLRERDVETVEDTLPFRESPTVTWLNVDGLHDLELLESLGSEFGLHPLVLEDIVNTGHRPKSEEFETYLFVVLKMLTFDADRRHLEDEQVSLVVGPSFVLSFQERSGDVLDPVRERIRAGKGRIRRMGPDYLAYAIMDAIVDHYFVVLEKAGEWMEELEAELVDDPTEETMREIHRLKRELLLFRKAAWPVREVAGTLLREEDGLMDAEVRPFIRDLYDHTVQIIDTGETLRDLASGMLDTYLSSVSNRMNEIMKVLTIMASIFIPLTFIAGIYGMNFEAMPELGWRWGYPAALGVMAAIGGGMALYFRSKDWL